MNKIVTEHIFRAVTAEKLDDHKEAFRALIDAVTELNEHCFSDAKSMRIYDVVNEVNQAFKSTPHEVAQTQFITKDNPLIIGNFEIRIREK